MKSHQTLAKHILDAINQVEQYTSNVDKDEFLSNFMIQDAVLRKLEIIGEASRRINPEIKEKFSDIPWRDIIAMRNKLDLADLKEYAQRILNFERL